VVPGWALLGNPLRTAFHLDRRNVPASANGLRLLRLRRRPDGSMTVSAVGPASAIPADYPAPLTWMLLLGDQCGLTNCLVFPRSSDCN
jgi:hypothetical protein